MLHFRENEICICVCSWKSTINPYNVNWQRINWRNVSFWTHLEFDKCDLEKSVLDIFDIDSFASFVCSICDSVYSLYTCKHCSKVVQWLFKGACVCVCGWWLFMHLYALIHMQRDVLIIVTSLLEISFQFSYLFKSSYISYSYAPAYACVYMLCMVLLWCGSS